MNSSNPEFVKNSLGFVQGTTSGATLVSLNAAVQAGNILIGVSAEAAAFTYTWHYAKPGQRSWSSTTYAGATAVESATLAGLATAVETAAGTRKFTIFNIVKDATGARYVATILYLK